MISTRMTRPPFRAAPPSRFAPAPQRWRCLGLAASLCCALGGAVPASAFQQVPAIGGLVDPAVALTRTYHGADGSALNMRVVGNTVVAVAEDAAGQQVLVFRGQLSGSAINGSYWGVPKGQSQASGPLTFSFADGGATLQRTGGHDIGPEHWIAKPFSALAYQGPKQASFQSIASNNLNGVFRGNDGSRAYVRQAGTTVVYVIERWAADNQNRPQYATVVIADRDANGKLSGNYYDLPKQTAALRSGTLLGQVAALPRRFQQALTSGTLAPGVTFTAEYAVDVFQLAQGIKQRMAGMAVGYSFSIAQNGRVVWSEAPGFSRLENGWAVPFETSTLVDVASASKAVTLVAVLRALRLKGIGVDAPVAPYLPPNWALGAGMGSVTFRQLLSHGTQPAGGNGLLKAGSCPEDAYDCLRDSVSMGMTVNPGYDNIHYALFRVILPYVLDPVGMHQVATTVPLKAARNELYSARFRLAVRDLLAAADVDADFAYQPGPQAAYRYTWGPPPALVQAPVDSEDDYLYAGSGGLKMSTVEYAQFLSRLERGDLLHKTDLTLAKSLHMGETSTPNGPWSVGPVPSKVGAMSGASSLGAIFPGVEIFISRNSTGHPAEAADIELLRDAWEAALIGL